MWAVNLKVILESSDLRELDCSYGKISFNETHGKRFGIVAFLNVAEPILMKLGSNIQYDVLYMTYQ